MARSDKLAVLLIHGIGEQRPMDTLRGFVDAVWTRDKSVHHKFAPAQVFSKPDTISGSFELRRLATTQNCAEMRTDFFEFYWAHLMEGTSLWHVLAWAKCLLWRSPRTVPRPLFTAWLLLVVLGLAFLFLFAQTALPDAWRMVHLSPWLTGTASLGLACVAMPVIKHIIGDAARYLDAAPTNIKRRQEIRKRGVELLEKIHAAGYQRVIVVGHSLGSVIAYDILTYAWAKYSDSFERKQDNPVLDALEADVVAGNLTAEEYQFRQRQLFDELEKNGCPWRVTDLLTMGSPLTHASILLAADAADLKEKQNSRELPTCPPQLEDGKFSFPLKAVHRELHHAAVFGPCRWTNLYFPSKSLVVGDLIGGPLAPLFGSGVRDVEVQTGLRCGLLSHTLYWAPEQGNKAASHLSELRKALNLLDARPDDALEPEE